VPAVGGHLRVERREFPPARQHSANAYIYGTGSTPTEQVSLSTGAISYLVSDFLGSVRGIVSPSGALVASTSYDAWGNPKTAGGISSYTPFGYAGGYTDPTGLIYLINRYYDPATGQFLSADPEVRSTNEPYGYAYGDPIIISDLSGLAPTAGWSGMSQGGVSIFYWNNDVGCHGYFREYPNPPIMSCAAVAVDHWGHKQVLREGYFNPEADLGFGREKAFILHNLWVQPILDTITRSVTATPADHGKKFTMHMYHFESNGVIDQEVNVVTSIEKHYVA
jgi:RHS repeat-associated protein